MHELVTTTSARDANGRWDAATYEEMLRIARHHLRVYANGATLSTSDVVHEAYLKLHRAGSACDGRTHFYALAARAMRHVLVDHARRRMAARRGGGASFATLRHAHETSRLPLDELITIDDALRRLESLSPRLVTVVELRFFGGFDDHEIAERLAVSTRTIERDWFKARLFLAQALSNA